MSAEIKSKEKLLQEATKIFGDLMFANKLEDIEEARIKFKKDYADYFKGDSYLKITLTTTLNRD